jgi:hypothetical protein
MMRSSAYSAAPPNSDRTNWQPIPGAGFNEGSLAGNNGLWRVLEMVCAAVRLE